MKKLIVFLIFVATIFFFYCSFQTQSIQKTNFETANVTTQACDKKGNASFYCVWLTYSEIGSLVKGQGEGEYRESIEAMLNNLTENKINTVFYQCRAFCDSFYNSGIFPVSKYITADAKAPNYDPFEIFLQMAEGYGISVHCWINPYRISYDSALENLPENSPARELYKGDKNALIICEEGVFLNPAHTESRKLVLSGIREILENYQVAGVHFDDYFYPESSSINDKALYKQYKEEGGSLSLDDWRRENVNVLIGSVYSLVKSKDSNLIFSISPSADIEKCKNAFYCDVEKWCREEGFVDFLIPQIYYGFENEEMPFNRVVQEWERLSGESNMKLICGLAVYKCGKWDEFAGTGENEWIENVNILKRQYEQVQKSQQWQGFSLFSYSHCFGENMNQISKKEIKNLLYMVE